jgi:hypothetical protein
MLRALGSLVRTATDRLVEVSVAAALVLLPAFAYAEAVDHTFSTTSPIFVDPLLSELSSATVSGSFTYDNAGEFRATVPPGSVTAGSAIYGSLSNLSGTVAGNAFDDPAGIIIVGDDRYTGFSPPTDAVVLVWDSALDSTLNGFTVAGMPLVNVRLFWIEGQSGIGDFLETEQQPAILPPTIAGTLALDFLHEDGSLRFAFFNVSVVPVIPADSDIAFSGPLELVLADDGTGIYSGVPVGTEFSGTINRLTSDGFISDGTTATTIDCCTGATGPGVVVENDAVLGVEEASLLNLIIGSSFVAGDLIDLISVEGDTTTPGGGRLEVGLSHVLDAQALDSDSRNHYPPDPADVLVTLYFILEENELDEDVYSAIGVVLAEPEDALADLVEDVVAIDLPSGLAVSLTSSLTHAIRKVEAGDGPAAMGMLQAFINKTRAQRGKKLSVEEADNLMTAAEATMRLLEMP